MHRNLTRVSGTVWESERIEEILRHCSNTATALQNNRAPSCPHVPSTSHSNATALLQRDMLQWNRVERNQISSASVTQQIYNVIQVWKKCTDSREAHMNFQRDLLTTCIFVLDCTSFYGLFCPVLMFVSKLLNYKSAKLLQPLHCECVFVCASALYLAWRTGTCERVESRGEWRLTSCIWALNRAHEDNWKDCIITWATPCGAKHSQLHHVRNRGHTTALKRIARKPDTHLTISSSLLIALQ